MSGPEVTLEELLKVLELGVTRGSEEGLAELYSLVGRGPGAVWLVVFGLACVVEQAGGLAAGAGPVQLEIADAEGRVVAPSEVDPALVWVGRVVAASAAGDQQTLSALCLSLVRLAEEHHDLALLGRHLGGLYEVAIQALLADARRRGLIAPGEGES